MAQVLGWVGVPKTVQGQWCFEQAMDAFIDTASLLSMAGRVPHVYTVCQALTAASSWTQAILLISGGITYERSMCLGLLAEDPWQLAILMRMFALLEVNEFMVYSFIEAFLGCLIELRVMHHWWGMRNSSQVAAGAEAGEGQADEGSVAPVPMGKEEDKASPEDKPEDECSQARAAKEMEGVLGGQVLPGQAEDER